jgi:hypothetical protein
VSNHYTKQALLSELVGSGYCLSSWSGFCLLCFNSIRQNELIVKPPVSGVVDSRWFHAKCFDKWLVAESKERSKGAGLAARRRRRG